MGEEEKDLRELKLRDGAKRLIIKKNGHLQQRKPSSLLSFTSLVCFKMEATDVTYTSDPSIQEISHCLANYRHGGSGVQPHWKP
jgi:hypothetical protein